MQLGIRGIRPESTLNSSLKYSSSREDTVSKRKSSIADEAAISVIKEKETKLTKEAGKSKHSGTKCRC